MIDIWAVVDRMKVKIQIKSFTRTIVKLADDNWIKKCPIEYVQTYYMTL